MLSYAARVRKQDHASGLSVNRKSLIIMDEVDGMSAGDRGGVGALNAVIKKSKVPIIAIANDAKSQKMKPLLNTTFQMLFKRSVLSLLSFSLSCVLGSRVSSEEEIRD